MKHAFLYARVYFIVVACAITVAAAPQNVPMGTHPDLRPKDDGYLDVNAYLRELQIYTSGWPKPETNHTGPKKASTRLRKPSTASQQQSIGVVGHPISIQRRRNLDGRTRVKLATDDVALVLAAKYYGTLTIKGQEAAPFFTRFDTTKSDLVVPGVGCENNAEFGCAGDNKYMEGGVPLVLGNAELSFASTMRVWTNKYVDTVSLGDLEVEHSILFSIHHAQDLPSFRRNSIAVMGLGFDLASGGSGSLSWFQQACHDGHFASRLGRVPEMSFFHGRVASGTQDLSQVTIGGHDETSYTGNIHQINVSSGCRWQIPIDGVIVESGRTTQVVANPRTSGNAIIDTTGILTILPIAVADQAFAAIPQSCGIYHFSGTYLSFAYGENIRRPRPGTPKAYAYPCNLQPVVSLILGDHGEEFAIDSRDLQTAKPGSSTDWIDAPGSTAYRDAMAAGVEICMSAILGQERTAEQGEYVLGTSFMKNWVTILGLGADGGPSYVGLAKSIDGVPQETISTA